MIQINDLNLPASDSSIARVVALLDICYAVCRNYNTIIYEGES